MRTTGMLFWSARLPLIAIVTVALLGTSMLRTAEAAPLTVSGGYLDWGVKASFRAYISGPIAHGFSAPEDGAGLNGDGSFRFPVASGVVDTAGNSLMSFTGSAHFTGHDGELDMVVSGLSVSLVGGSGTLRATVTSRTLSSGATQTYPNIVLAQLAGAPATMGANTATWTALSSILSAQGAPAFSGFYTAGTALDPVTLQLTTSEDGAGVPVETGGSSSPAPATTAIVSDGDIKVSATLPKSVTTESGANTRVEVSVGGTTATVGTVARVDVPATSLPAGATLKASAVADLAQLATQASPPTNTTLAAGLIVQASTSAGDAITKLGAPVTLNFNLPSTAVPLGTTSKDLLLVFWNGTAWSDVPGTAITATGGRFDITGTVDHFTLFAVLSAPGIGTFSPAVETGMTLAVWKGGGYSRMATALSGATSVWVTADGQFLGYLVGVPAFVNAPFIAKFPNGLPSGTPVITIR